MAELSEYDNFVSDILRPIMRVRPPGTKGHHKVKTVFTPSCKPFLKTNKLGTLPVRSNYTLE